MAALVAGRIGDRIGLARVIVAASAVYGTGLVAGGLGREWHTWYLGAVFLVAIAGGTVMTLAWGLLFKLMPPGERGAISGLATTTKGIGLVIGPLLAGAVIDLLGSRLESTDGYQALWPMLGVPILLVIPLVSAPAATPRRPPGSVSPPSGRRSRRSSPGRRRACAPRACPRR